MQQRAFLYPHLILRQNAVYRRYGAEVIVLPSVQQMHMYHLCHIRSFPFVLVIAFLVIYYLFSLANIPNNNYLEEYASIKSTKRPKIKGMTTATPSPLKLPSFHPLSPPKHSPQAHESPSIDHFHANPIKRPQKPSNAPMSHANRSKSSHIILKSKPSATPM